MKDLLKEYFKRDLSPAEEEKLFQQLSASETESMRFSREAGKFYAALGLPVAALAIKAALAKAGMGKGILAGIGQALAAKAVLVGTMALAGASTIWYVVSKEEAAPASEALQAKPKEAARAEVSGDALFIRLDLPSAREITVRILDAKGLEIRHYDKARYEAGTQRLGWDGKDQQGVAAKPGTYTVEVDYGSGKLRRKLAVRAGQ